MTIPINRVVAFAGPVISTIAGAAAAWLVGVVNILAIPGLDQANLATWISAGLTGLLTAGLLHLGQSKWLKGHHILLAAEAQAAAVEQPPANLSDEPAPAAKAPARKATAKTTAAK